MYVYNVTGNCYIEHILTYVRGVGRIAVDKAVNTSINLAFRLRSVQFIQYGHNATRPYSC